jgi:protein TonB
MSIQSGAATVFDSAAQRRALPICVGVSVALHGLVLFAVPAFRTGTQTLESRPLTATFARNPALSGREASIEQSLPARPDRAPPRPEHEMRPELPQPALPAAPSASRLPAPASGATPSPSTPSAADTPAASTAAKAPTAPVGSSAQASSGSVDDALLEKYRLGLIDAARRYRRYPELAMERGWQGRVEVRLVIGTDGTVKSVSVKTSSSYRILDDQALDMVKRGKGLAPVPPPLQGREFTVDVPVIFELQTG